MQEVTFTRAGRGVGSGLARQREGRVLQIETPSKCQGPEAEERSSGKDRVGGGARGTRCAWTSRRGPGVRVHRRPAGVTTSRGVGTGRVGARAGVGAPALGESAPGRPRLLRAELSSSPKCLSVAPVTTATERLLVIV